MGIISDDPEAERRQEQRVEQDHQRNLSSADAEPQMFDQEGSLRREVIDELTDADVSEGVQASLSNLLTKDFVLGNLTDAEVHEIKWLARQQRLEITDIHPHERSVWRGEFGQFFFESEFALDAQPDLTQTQMEQLLMDVAARAARGREGFQTEQLNTSINVSERRDSDDSDSGGWL